MSALLIGLAIVLFLSAYHSYGRMISRRFGINDSKETPSHTLEDDIDYMPAKKPVLFGHQFASIAGAGPIIGPVLAAAFGWLPVFIWIIAGSIFIGGVHDYGSIIISVRHKGKSIGKIIEAYIGISGRTMFLIFAWATLILIMAVFSLVIADTFNHIPAAGTSSILFILIAMLFGYAIYKLKLPLFISSVVGVFLLFGAIVAGLEYPLQLDEPIWMIILFGYVAVVSVAPVWVILQPRDYLNSFFLYSLLLGGILGIFFSLPEIQFPVFTTFHNEKLGYLFPALFVVVACGAISGFHSIVGSGTTSKQLDKETDAHFIGYGGMLLEGVLGAMALLAAVTLSQTEYASILADAGPVSVFSKGVGGFIEAIPLLNISASAAETFTALAVAAFALTTMDTGTRLARYTLQELFEKKQKKESSKAAQRLTTTAITIAAAAGLAFSGQSMSIWAIFGSANQMLAALTLITITVWLAHLGKKFIFTIIPMAFMYLITLTALGFFFYRNIAVTGTYSLAVISVLLFLLAVVIGLQSFKALKNSRGNELEANEKT